jgi:hypothetical protein
VRIKNWEFDRNEFEIKKRTSDNRILSSRARSKQGKYYSWWIIGSEEEEGKNREKENQIRIKDSRR